MKHTEVFECPCCGGEAVFEISEGPRRVSHDCNESCENHPHINPMALSTAFDVWIEGEYEKRFERRLANG